MTTLKSPLEIYKFLPATNCKKCMFPSCMAFAAAVFKGEKTIEDCPDLEAPVELNLPSSTTLTQKPEEASPQGDLSNLQQAVTQIDFAAVAEKLRAKAEQGTLVFNCLGKDFAIDKSGNLTSECHCNLWVHIPLLHYILHGKGLSPVGDWQSFNQLQGAGSWASFFTHRCEHYLQQLADSHSDLLFDLLHMFGEQAKEETGADFSILLHPLPTLPLLINYWLPEDDFESKLTILFDKTAPENLPAEFIFRITSGIVEMFRLFIVKHNSDGKLF